MGNKSVKRAGVAVAIHRYLFGAFVSLVILIAGSVLTISLLKTSSLLDRQARFLIDSVQRETETELRRFFDPIEEKAAISYEWVRAGMVKRYDEVALMKLFRPVMIQLPQSVSMMVSDMKGYEFTIFRGDPGEHPVDEYEPIKWLTRDYRLDRPSAAWEKRAKWSLWAPSNFEVTKIWWEDAVWTMEEVLEHSPSGLKRGEIRPEDLIYDPVKRDWHEGARASYLEWSITENSKDSREALYWTEIDYFFTSKAPGITVGAAALDERGEPVVIAFDLLLDELSSFTGKLQPTKGGQVFIFTESGEMIGFPHNERFQDESIRRELMLRPVEESALPELVSTMEYWQSEQFRERLPFRFSSGGQSWWTGILPFDFSSEQRRLWIAVVIPEADLLRSAREEQFSIVSISLLALLLALFLAWYISRWFSSPLSALTEQSRRIAAMELDVESSIDSRFREVRQLSDSLEKMRLSLQSYIKERIESENELRHLRNYLSNIINSMPSVVIGVDTDYRITHWNRRAEVVTGVKVSEAVGGELTKIFPRLEGIISDIEESIGSGKVKHERKRGRSSENEVAYEDITIYPLIENSITGAVIQIDDVTEKVNMEEMIIQSEKMLSIGGLAAGMAHEINNPLACMVQSADVIGNRLGENIGMGANLRAAEEAGVSIEAIDKFIKSRNIISMINDIKEAGQRIADIVKNMLNFSRKEGGKRDDYSLNELIEKTLKLARTDFNLRKKYDFRQIEIKKEYDENLPPLCCEGPKIQQVILNILLNGAQAMQEGRTDKPMFIIRTSFDRKRNMACFEIENNGPHISEEACKRLFEPFYTTKPLGVGTGLGLSVSYYIITEDHKGEMAVESHTALGVNFIVRLPLDCRF